ncbi:MAG: RCC1 domain-containing protein, partial [Gammaproteobacteria bacterium]|nr:RCC1 domain-containing protein [Gammaproteobacteria bacterium]
MFKCSYILIFAILTLVLTACGSGAKQTEVFIYPHELISDYGRNGCGIHQQELICWGKFFGEQQPKIEHPIQVSVGSEHACVLHKDGVSCWGNNTWGQTDVPALKNPIQVKAGARHSCALERGKVVCWGESNQAKVPPLDHPKQISVAGSHNCVLDRHQVKCWDSKSSVLERVPQLRDRPSFVSAAASSACAVTLAESLVTISCWNADSSVIKRELSDPTLTPTLSLINLDGGKFCTVIDNKISCSGASPVPAELQAPVQYASRTCALDASGIVCWGESYVDELEFPPAVDAGIYLDVDDYNSCVIDRNNQIKCSQGFNFERYLPDDLSHPRELGLGYRTSCALDDNGLQCWKLINNPSRELVLLNTPVVSEPSQLNVNYESACVVDSGSVVCWG